MNNRQSQLTLLAFCLVAVLYLAGCATPPEERIVNLNRQAADTLAAQLISNGEVPFTREDRILVATVANVDRMDVSSSLGRITSDQVASRLAAPQWRFNVAEVKLRENLFVQRERGEYKTTWSPHGGEFALARNIDQIAREHDAAVIIAGTYAGGKTHTIISLRAIDVATKRIIAGHDYAVPAVPREWIDPPPQEKLLKGY